MDNCDVKFGELTRTVATKNVTISALVALFNIHNAQTCWLRGLSDTYVFADENGAFPQLESFGLYELEVSRGSDIRNAKRNYESSDEESSDSEFMQTAYRLATTSSKSAKKGKRKVPKGKGPRVQGSKALSPAAVETDHSSWYFKVTVGEKVDSKIRPVRNCLVKCNISTSCSDVKEALSRELLVQPANIVLYDSDFLEISDSPGREGKIFVMLFFQYRHFQLVSH